ncbi:MAG TPA: BPSS1780 family membrane protein [Burkholderiaceae bacterium]|nr:BPSS1780 family membrane protein [Burkholderiaceae bacterium]
MEKLPAKSGWLWVKEGFALFRKQPAEMSTLFMAYMFLMLVVGLVPLLGQVLPLFLVPIFSIGFLQACANVERGQRVFPNLLLTGFRSPARNRLLQLGVLYLLAAILAIALSSIIDGGVFWQAMSGQRGLEAETVRDSNMVLAMLFAATLYTPAAMAFWYAAPLIAWQDMGVAKAIFYSFFAVYRQGRAFLVYGLAWAALGVLLPVVASLVTALLFEKAIITVMVLLPLSIVLTVIMYCSFYPTYTHVFGKPVQGSPA